MGLLLTFIPKTKKIYLRGAVMDSEINRIQDNMEESLTDLGIGLNGFTATFSENLKVGDLKASLITFDQFKRMKNNTLWIPCDGRAIRGSQLNKFTGLANAPNISGVLIGGVEVHYYVKVN